MSALRPLLLVSLLTLASPRVGWSVDLLEVYRQARASDPQLKAASADREANQEAKPQARALLLPNISASASRERNFGVETNTPGSDSAYTNYAYGINLTQPLFNQGSLVRGRQADLVVTQADADLLAAQQDLIVRVVERYFGALSAIVDLTFRTADKDATGRQLEQAKRRFDVGLVTITDVFEAQARFDLAVATEIQARNQVANAKEALREITGETYDTINDLAPDAPLEPPKPADPEAWVKQALETNPQLRSAALGADISRENINLQKADHYPRVDLVAGYSDSETAGRESRGSAIGVQVNVPIYQGGAVVSRTREAAFQHESAKENLERQQRQVTRQVRESYRGLETALKQVKAFDQARVSNKSSLDATQAGFEVGTRTIVDVLDAQRDLFQAERDYFQSRYDYIINFLRLGQAAGRLGEENLQTLNVWLKSPVTGDPEKPAPAPAPKGETKPAAKEPAKKPAAKPSGQHKRG